MNDTQSLKDCITEYRKANKKLDDRLKMAEKDVLRRRQEQEERLSRQR